MEALEKQIASEIEKTITLSLNYNNGDRLPYFLRCSKFPKSEGKLIWICAPDEHSKITSVYAHVTPGGKYAGRHVTYISKEEATFSRDCLLKEGWVKETPTQPKINVTFAS